MHEVNNKKNVKKITLINQSKIITPVLILCFDRPDNLKILFKYLKKYHVQNIYISQDGYSGLDLNIRKRHNEVKNLIRKIDWTKSVKKNFFKKNLGKQIAPPKGVDWFFKKVKKGIIIEDDTIPSRSFFSFCDILLKKHLKNRNIFQICGSATLPRKFGNITYISSLPFMHGWATWRNRWARYKYKMKNIEELRNNKNFIKNVPNFYARLFWLSLFKEFKDGKHKTWDYTIVKDCISNNLGCIKPSFNMISNIGYKDSRHPLNKRKKLEVKKFNHLVNKHNNYKEEKIYEGWILYNLSFRYRFSLLIKYFLKLI